MLYLDMGELSLNIYPLLYGCGSVDILELGGLAVVGSRDVDSTLGLISIQLFSLPPNKRTDH